MFKKIVADTVIIPLSYFFYYIDQNKELFNTYWNGLKRIKNKSTKSFFHYIFAIPWQILIYNTLFPSSRRGLKIGQRGCSEKITLEPKYQKVLKFSKCYYCSVYQLILLLNNWFFRFIKQHSKIPLYMKNSSMYSKV
jgi:hypothetical protein